MYTTRPESYIRVSARHRSIGPRNTPLAPFDGMGWDASSMLMRTEELLARAFSYLLSFTAGYSRLCDAMPHAFLGPWMTSMRGPRGTSFFFFCDVQLIDIRSLHEWIGGLPSACLLASFLLPFFFLASGEELVDIFNTSASVEVLYCSLLSLAFLLYYIYPAYIYTAVYTAANRTVSPLSVCCLVLLIFYTSIPRSRPSLSHQAFVCSVIHISITLYSEIITLHSLSPKLVRFDHSTNLKCPSPTLLSLSRICLPPLPSSYHVSSHWDTASWAAMRTASDSAPSLASLLISGLQRKGPGMTY